jgi:hypothetical protein
VTARRQIGPTLRALQALLRWPLAQIGRRTRQRRIFQHPCPHLPQALIQRGLDLAQRRLGMLKPPLLHPAHHFLGQLIPLRIKIVPHGNAS